MLIFKKHANKIDISLIFLMLCISICSNSLRNIRETIAISSMGVESIMILKAWGTLPLSVLFLLFYKWLSQKRNFLIIFKVFIIGYFVLFIVFDIFMSATALKTVVHSEKIELSYYSLAPYFRCVQNWEISLFFVFTEIWGVLVYSILFWQIANWIYSLEKAEEFYPYLGIYNNIGALIAGLIIFLINSETIFFLKNMGISSLLQLVIFLHLVILIIFSKIASVYDLRINTMKNKIKISELKNIIQEKDKKILIYLSSVVLFYGFTLNYIDLIYKDLMKSMLINSISLSANLGLITIFISFISIGFCIFANNTIKYFGWLTSALISPFILAFLAIVFFMLLFLSENLIIDLTLPIIIIGVSYTAMNKALKDSFYEPTKEMVFIPMDKKDKQESKAFISLIVNKLSKSISSGYQQILIFVFGQFSNASINIFAFLLIAFGGWIYSIKRLSSIIQEESSHEIAPSDVAYPSSQKKPLYK